MTIQPINEHDIALFIGKSDLEKMGLSPEELDINDARQMASRAFASAGLECGSNLEIEAFASSCGVLVFARNAPIGQGVWCFAGFEDMIDAVCALGEPGCKASVIHSQGKWYITAAYNEAANVLDEYGERHQNEPIFAEHLKEHGVTVLDGAMTGTLRSYFTALA